MVIFSDSKSALHACPVVHVGSSHSSDYYEIFSFLTFCIIHKIVNFCELPRYMRISGNEHADSAVKAALQKDISKCLISYTDAYQYIRDLWQSEWYTAVNNKIHATKPLIGEQLSTYRSVCRDKVVYLD